MKPSTESPGAAPDLFFVGWRKTHGAPWVRVDASRAPTRAACYEALMTACELTRLPDGSDVGPLMGRAEYLILPDDGGKTTPIQAMYAQGGNGSSSSNDRMKRRSLLR